MNYFPESMSLPEATALQEQFAEQVKLEDEFSIEPRTFGGAVITARDNAITTSMAILDAKTNEVRAKSVRTHRVTYAAIPTCEGFRDGNILSQEINQLESADVYFIYGHGRNHPRRFGLVSHVGLALDIPTIAVSKELICGKVQTINGHSLIYDNEECVGEMIRQKPDAASLYVSPGHKVSLSGAVAVAKSSMHGPIPEPIRVAQAELQLYLMAKLKEQ